MQNTIQRPSTSSGASQRDERQRVYPEQSHGMQYPDQGAHYGRSQGLPPPAPASDNGANEIEEEMPNFDALTDAAKPITIDDVLEPKQSTMPPAILKGTDQFRGGGFPVQTPRVHPQPDVRAHGGPTGYGQPAPPMSNTPQQTRAPPRMRAPQDVSNVAHRNQPNQMYQETDGYPPRGQSNNYKAEGGYEANDQYHRGPNQYPPQHNSAHPQGQWQAPPRSQSRGERRPDASRQMDPQSGFGRPPVNGQMQSPPVEPAPHPTPVRPGLATGPSPIRQYDNGPSPMQQAMQPSTPVQAPPVMKNRTSGPVTAQELSQLQEAIKRSPQDYPTQFRLAKKMIEASSVLADEGGRADAKTKSKNRERYILDAHKLLKKLVNAGYPEAMFYLADCHGSGYLGLQVDPKEAFNLYQSAAKTGHAQAAYRVAVCCEMGQEEGGGTRRDPIKSVQWYKRAASLGNTPAMYKVGMIMLKGLLGQPKSPKDAVTWLKRAADQADVDNPHALHELGLMYEANNEGVVIRDENYARELFEQAAALGYKYSQYRLGCAYEYGTMGCPVDPRQSIAWYSKAAMQEEHQSELALSGWYLTGSEGIIQQSDTEAYLWAKKAGQAGLAKAEYAMGYFTEVGIGAPANIEDAKRWYWRAACEYFPATVPSSETY